MEFIDFFNWLLVLFGGETFTSFLIVVCTAFGAYIICLIFGGIGMREMAKRRGMKGSWLGFLPFANTYYAGKLAGDGNFFGQKLKRAGLYAMLSEIVYAVLNGLLVMTMICLSPYYVEYGPEDIVQGGYEGVPEALQWMQTGQWVFQVLVMLFTLVMIVFMAVLYLSLFRKYYARGPAMLTFCSVVLPFRAFTVFAVRNNVPVDYADYVRRQQEEIYRRTQGMYGDPRNYGNPTDGGRREDPFGDFPGGTAGNGSAGGAPEDPFSEFSSSAKPPEDGEKKD